MSDFKPAPANAHDDYSPPPMAPMPELPTIEQDQTADDIEETKLAQAYWHPAWSKVQEIFELHLAGYRTNGAVVHQELPADEFKIRMLTDAHVAGILEQIMEDVKRAVEQVESRPKPAKPTTKGK